MDAVCVVVLCLRVRLVACLRDLVRLIDLRVALARGVRRFFAFFR